MGRGTTEGNYLIEIDGITAVRAMNVSGGGLNQTPTLVPEGNKPNPNVVRGTYEIAEVTVKQATALNDTGREFFAWLFDFCKGFTTERRGARLIELDEDGLTPVHIIDWIDCVPTSFDPDDRAARGNNQASFSFKFKPEDIAPAI
jgi:hypothetical protein